MNLMIIGAGQLGSRHLQSAVSSSHVNNIIVVDPSPISLEIARNRAQEVMKKPVDISYVADIPQHPSRIDFCIIATSSAQRLKALNSVLEKNQVDSVILEKFLFQTSGEYQQAEKLLGEVPAWVNCPRRLYPIYQTLQRTLAGKGPRRAIVSGGDWGLACNGIHFIDLFSFLLGTTLEKIQIAEVWRAFPAKRAGYFDVQGELLALWPGFEVILRSDDSERPLTVTIECSCETLVIEEGQRRLIRKTAQGEIVEPLTIPLQSELTAHCLDDIIKKQVSLTPYRESMEMHLSFLGVMNDFFTRSGHAFERCPIT